MYRGYKYYFEKWNDIETAELENMGEYFAAGFLSGDEVPVMLRMAAGILNHLSKAPLPVYEGSKLYPSGNVHFWYGPAMWHSYIFMLFDLNKLNEKINEASGFQKRVLEKLKDFIRHYPKGGGHTHSIPNYGRILQEGLAGFADRICISRENKSFIKEKDEFLCSMEIVCKAINVLIKRIVCYLGELNFDDEMKLENRNRLIKCFNALQENGADSFEQGMIISNFIFYFDGNDNIGRFDQFMEEYYITSKEKGLITSDQAIDWIKELWNNIDETNGWNVTLGGSKPNGGMAYNELTVLSMKAAKGRRRPNIALRLRRDTPEEIWDEALECISSGNGLPALYCEETYLNALEESRLNIVGNDIYDFAFGGCTETMVQGCSNVGSLDAELHVLKVLEETLYKELEGCSTFHEFLAVFKVKLGNSVYDLIESVNRNQERRAKYHPHLIRSFLIDDCIDTGREYSSGGARYNWSVINVTGIGNVADSLMAVKKLISEEKIMHAAPFMEHIASNFKEYPELQKKLLTLPKYGNGNDEVDELAKDVSGFVFKELKKYAPWRGGRFLGSCIMFVTYGNAGKGVGATPDGRPKDAPISDSAGAVQGRDRNGPTSLMRSAASLEQIQAPGTLVVNIRFTKKMFSDMESREKIKSLIKTYFKIGGMQLQINVVDQNILKDAIEHPESYEDLVIRMGGYSEYFNRLTDELKIAVMERTAHEA